ncbi:galactitol-1-phosphate 5-dehydrogenase [candidate division KSB1 bacterium]|nr:galactitol-1-phosphate 5-dehydrogenase [candidate division KSB1 bacterium]
MKALVLTEYFKFEYKDMPDPVPGPDDVLVQVKACGICGSDIHGFDGSTGRRIPPIIMGHEASGMISDTGANVSAYKTGNRVTFDSTIYCGKCFFCQTGKINLCDNRRVLGVSCKEYRQHGALAEYVVVPQHILHPLPHTVRFEQAAMVEPCSIAVHAVKRTPISLDDMVLVVGTGMIGLLVIQALRAAGCGTIVAVDIEKDKLDLACQLGAGYGVNPALENVEEKILQLTNGRGVDVAFDVVGTTQAFATALKAVRKGGSVTLVGNLSPSVEMALQWTVTREITLYGSCASQGEYTACLEMMSRGDMNVDILLGAVAPLAEGGDWFQKLYKKEKGLYKVILQP